ncbi:hypothetical protein [Mycolicibacterium sp. CBMA 226]|uniref:hypothetical protein n=1 Tax=Mycolicibacterium sp. CBMA 226 TaxID=2606611 RepID=UPI0012DEE0A5|nr:hypothetical protein [Mycolicibacterium sp. CBMA 226]MUL76470.1 hypothetical protein [Mycolicibacterium sp. CBMA 226]
MTEPVSAAQNTLRSEILDAASHDWVPMIEVDQIVTQQQLAAGDGERFDLVTSVVRTMLQEGLVSVGDLPGDGAETPDWGLSPDASVERIRGMYVDRHGEPEEWQYRIWFGLALGGDVRATSAG